MRRSPKVAEVLPILYLRGLSTGDFEPALAGFFGSGAGLSASTVTRLTEAWRAEYDRWSRRDLSAVDYVYLCCDGVDVNVRLPDRDGARESTDSWADVLRDLRARGMAAPCLAVGDGALGLWAALRDVWPQTAHQRCWVHKTANVLSALPQRHEDAERLLAAVWSAPTRADALEAAETLADELAAHPKATAKISGDLDVLPAFYDFPAEHWRQRRTSNGISVNRPEGHVLIAQWSDVLDDLASS